MRSSKHVLIGLLPVVFLCGSVGLVLPPPSQAEVQFGGIKEILNERNKKILKQISSRPCGPGTRPLLS